MESTMKTIFSIGAITGFLLGATSATAAELPTFEFKGLPITAHQAALLGLAGVQESSPTPALTLGGMPASPLQIVVLTRHRSIKAAAAMPAIGAVQPK